MPSTKLTKRNIDAFPDPVERTFYFDTELKGFGLKFEPSGIGTFFVEYRAGAGGRTATKRRLTLGKLGALAPDEARDLARVTLARVAAGEDPARIKIEARIAPSMAELCRRYLADAEAGRIIGKGGRPKKASTVLADRSRIACHVLPLLGHKAVRDVTKADVERFLRDVAAGKTHKAPANGRRGTAHAKGGKGTATRTVRLLGGMFTYAIEHGLRTDNPVRGVKLYRDGAKETFLGADELDRLGAALRLAETDGLPWTTDDAAPGAKHLPRDIEKRRTRIDPFAAAAIRLLLFTGCRLGEILALEWAHVDMERGLLRLPDSKTGAKVVVLGAPALDVLAKLPRVEGCRYVIAGASGDAPRKDLKRPWAMVTRAAGLDGVRLHDLRHTFASHGASAGLGLLVIGRLLGHADVKTTNRYAHLADDPLRRAADMVGAGLAAALGEGGGGTVVPFKVSNPTRS